MANRDTTSTPYSLSADGVCYFAYPTGNAPIITVANYTVLRTKGAADSPTDSISVTDAAIAGTFKWKSAAQSPLTGITDDGGIVINASDGGCWVRVYSGPIYLDWYNPTDGFVWTTILKQIADAPSISEFNIRTPTISTYGSLDRLVIQKSIARIESAGPLYSFKQTSLADTVSDKLTQLVFHSARVYLGANVEFYGRFDNKIYTRSAPGQEYALAEVHTLQLLSFEFYCRISEPRAVHALAFFNDGMPSSGFERCILGGIVTSGDIDLINGYSSLFPLITCAPGFKITDPFGIGLGIPPGNPDGTHDDNYTRGCVLSLSMAYRYEGEYIHEWGYCSFGSIVGGRDGIGTAQNPFKFYLVNMGYTQARPNNPVTYDAQSGIGKFDGYDNTTQAGTLLAPVYLDYIFQGKCAFHWGLVLEVSGQSVGEIKRIEGFHIRTFIEFPESNYTCTHISLRSDMDPEVSQNSPGYVRNNTFSGIYNFAAISDGPNTFTDMVMTGKGFAYYGVFGTAFNRFFRDPSTDNPGDTINNMTLRPPCTDSNRREVTMAFDSGDTTITNLVVEGAANPTYALIQLGHTDSNFPGRGNITLNLVNPVIPTGHKVVQVPGHVGGTVIFKVNGVTKTLPWTAP